MGCPELTCEEVSNCFIAAPPVINSEICNRSVEHKKHWFTMVPGGNYAWGEGYEKTKYTFRGGKVPDDLEWVEVEEERAPGTLGPNDPGHNPCEYDAHLITFGLEALNYRAFRTHTRTNKFCLDSMLHKHALNKQFDMMVDAMTSTTVGVYEIANRLFYLMFCDIYIATDTPASFLATKYTPSFIGDMPNIAGVNVMPLTMGHLQYLYMHMQNDVGQYAIDMTDGAPDFGLSASTEQIHAMYSQTPEDFDVLKRNPNNKLLDGFGFTYSRKHFIMMTDPKAMRFKETAPGSGQLQQVFPEKFEAKLCGASPYASTEYAWDAPYELSIIVFKPGSVVTVNTPAPKTQFSGGADFGPRNYYGEFMFVRPPKDCGNEKQNYGWWFNEYFAEPEPGCTRAVAILHARCLPQRFDFGFCEACPPDPCPTAPDPLAGVTTPGPANTLDIDLTGTELATDPGLALPIGYLVAVTFGNNDVELGTVIDNAGSPVHRLQFNVADIQAYHTAFPVIGVFNPDLVDCATVCNCDDNVGDPEDVQVEFTEGAISMGVGGTVDVGFGDDTWDTATIKEIGVASNATGRPTYVLTFAAPRTCEDNDGIVTVGLDCAPPD